MRRANLRLGFSRLSPPPHVLTPLACAHLSERLLLAPSIAWARPAPPDDTQPQAHGPEETHDQTHYTTTYDLAMCHADGPRRVDTMLWSGITKVASSLPFQRRPLIGLGYFCSAAALAKPDELPVKPLT
jgi:hypothetical protein